LIWRWKNESRKQFISSKKKTGLSQEMVAEKLGVSRQTISKWETDETIPDVYQSKKLAKLYNLSLDELIDSLEKMIDKTTCVPILIILCLLLGLVKSVKKKGKKK